MTGLPFKKEAGGPRLSVPSICPIAEGVIKYRGALGKPEIDTVPGRPRSLA